MSQLTKQITAYIFTGIFLIWVIYGWIHWIANPELSQMQVFIHMIGG